MGIKDKTGHALTPEEQAAVGRVTETLLFENGRYSIGISWTDGEPKLENNYEVALMRLRSQERSLKKRSSSCNSLQSNL